MRHEAGSPGVEQAAAARSRGAPSLQGGPSGHHPRADGRVRCLKPRGKISGRNAADAGPPRRWQRRAWALRPFCGVLRRPQGLRASLRGGGWSWSAGKPRWRRGATPLAPLFCLLVVKEGAFLPQIPILSQKGALLGFLTTVVGPVMSRILTSVPKDLGEATLLKGSCNLQEEE